MSKFKKVSPKRAFACLLVLFALLTVFTALAENAAETEPVEEVAAVEQAVRGFLRQDQMLFDAERQGIGGRLRKFVLQDGDQEKLVREYIEFI